MWLAALPKIATALLSIVSEVVAYLGRKQLLDAGSDQAIRKGLENVLEQHDKARRASAAVSGDSEWAERVRKKYLRD